VAVSAGAGAYAQGGDADVERFINLFNGEMVEYSASIPTVYRLTPGYARMLRALVRELAGTNAPASALKSLQRNCCVHVVRYADGRFTLQETGKIFYSPDDIVTNHVSLVRPW
jgi:hypothetical protein